MPPKDFPPWRTVYWWFRRLLRLTLSATIHELAVMLDRQRAGRTEAPSAGVLDIQTVKAPAAGAGRDWDGAKRTVGRKRRIAADADGRLLMVNLSPADIPDSAGAKAAPRALRAKWPWMKTLFADSACGRAGLMDEAAMLDFTAEVVRRIDGQTRFQVLPGRWVVERTPDRVWGRLFASMTRWRRLVRDYQARIDVSEAMTHIAMASLLIRRISH
jgi:transposase